LPLDFRGVKGSDASGGARTGFADETVTSRPTIVDGRAGVLSRVTGGGVDSVSVDGRK
jgi:hypothetical protein